MGKDVKMALVGKSDESRSRHFLRASFNVPVNWLNVTGVEQARKAKLRNHREDLISPWVWLFPLKDESLAFIVAQSLGHAHRHFHIALPET